MSKLLGLVIAGMFLVTGCATVHESAITKEDRTLSLNGEGMILLSLQVNNQYQPDYQPQIIVVNVETPNAKNKKDRHNFKTDLDGTVSSANGTRYLMRMQLKEGKYIARGAFCAYNSLFVHANCFVPIHTGFEVKANKVTYLLPLIDQSVSGFASSTFDVTIEDQSNNDIKAFKSNFPALRSTEVVNAILPPFDRDKAQSWWEKH